ncbi:hypothetical protein ACZ87_03713 [Candidatus Erwinia dacicola]|uniref:Uncharacterized protein n=1 Tax=Candidatus Erwinia dacicola TaxID=252393 RepID=A0A328TJV1_9GAMM|nr:hypothetical protein ACZ87_03713 [Candidatus Erwinia dacicola]
MAEYHKIQPFRGTTKFSYKDFYLNRIKIEINGINPIKRIKKRYFEICFPFLM